MVPKPRRTEFPTTFTILVSPGRTLKVGTPALITLKYDGGDWHSFDPRLELVRSPSRHPAEPIACGTLVKKQGQVAEFAFTPEELGSYALRLRPFQTINAGQLIELFSISSEEERQLAGIFKRSTT